LPAVVRTIADLACELIGPLHVMFPKINAVAKPVVVVLAGSERSLAGQDYFGHRRVAAVVAEDKRGRGGVHSSR
jgi:hypothetical protein